MTVGYQHPYPVSVFMHFHTSMIPILPRRLRWLFFQTESSWPTTQNAFQRAGWQTDDKGNVFIGTDDSKLYLISVGTYWPFPKDYRK
uniref:Uncharacterized protein n=1 Tax=Angiostrongylus cantonensis TaxID=6313 RepID=A0A0K0CZG8_ANGCA